MVAVSLGVMKTAMVDASSNARLAAVHRIGRMSEIADGISYQQQASLVTGEILHIDRGQSAGHRDPDQPSLSKPRERRSSHAF